MHIQGCNRLRPIIVYDYLLRYTSKKSKKSVYQIMDYLENYYGITTTRKTMCEILIEIEFVNPKFRVEQQKNPRGGNAVNLYWIDGE